MKIHFENADGSVGSMELAFRPASVKAREDVRVASEEGAKRVRNLEKEVAEINARNAAINARKEAGEPDLDAEIDAIQVQINSVNARVARAYDEWNWAQLRCAVTQKIQGKLTDEFLCDCDQQEIAEAVAFFRKRAGL